MGLLLAHSVGQNGRGTLYTGTGVRLYWRGEFLENLGRRMSAGAADPGRTPRMDPR